MCKKRDKQMDKAYDLFFYYRHLTIGSIIIYNIYSKLMLLFVSNGIVSNNIICCLYNNNKKRQNIFDNDVTINKVN